MRRSPINADTTGANVDAHESACGVPPAEQSPLQYGSISTQIMCKSRKPKLVLALAVDEISVSIAFKSLFTQEPTADEARLLLDALGNDLWNAMKME